MFFTKKINKFFKQLFCFHTYTNTVGYSKRRSKYVEQCLMCGKYFYTKNG